MRLRVGYEGCYMSSVVSVVITCYNQAHFLREAIESILSQSYSNNEIIVVDDGSTDNTSQIAASYPTLRYIYQKNQGLSAARNTGLQKSRGDFVVFLDADDRLLPIALETGVECLHMGPDYAFASGHHSVIRMDGSLKPLPSKPCVVRDHYLELLRGNYIGMHATVMYRRSVFETVGLFDTSLKACEDYDLYLRITRKAPVYCHDKITAEYRHHDANMSRDRALMLKFSLKVLRSQRKYLVNDEQREAFRIGTQFWRTMYGDRLIRDKRAFIAGNDWRHTIDGIPVLLRYYPRGFARLAPYLSVRALVGVPRIVLQLARKFKTGTRARAAQMYFSWWRGYEKGRPPVGRVRFGDLRRCTPISRRFGFDRGLPVDRYYIERFLSDHRDDVRGHVLEIGDDSYTKRFGNGQVLKSDVFDVSEGNPQATIVGDLSRGDNIPSDTFDCVILTQTLQLIHDARAALKTVYRILKPGGVLLATFPGISQIVRDAWRKHWHWSFTHVSAKRLFEEVFPAANVTIDVSGNVLTAAAFLYGLAAEELRQEELDYSDSDYELLIAVKAVKPFQNDAIHIDRTSRTP